MSRAFTKLLRKLKGSFSFFFNFINNSCTQSAEGKKQNIYEKLYYLEHVLCKVLSLMCPALFSDKSHKCVSVSLTDLN